MEEKLTLEQLIGYCRYYKGENECPENCKKKDAWKLEKDWCFHMQNENFKGMNDRLIFSYKKAGLEEYRVRECFISLMAYLFNRHCHWFGGYGIEEDVKDFKEWYEEYYIGVE